MLHQLPEDVQMQILGYGDDATIAIMSQLSVMNNKFIKTFFPPIRYPQFYLCSYGARHGFVRIIKWDLNWPHSLMNAKSKRALKYFATQDSILFRERIIRDGYGIVREDNFTRMVLASEVSRTHSMDESDCESAAKNGHLIRTEMVPHKWLQIRRFSDIDCGGERAHAYITMGLQERLQNYPPNISRRG